MAAGSGAIITSAVINGITCLIAFLVFSIIRRLSFAVKFYEPNRHNPNVRVKPHALPTSLFGWVAPIWRYSEPDIIKTAGLDAAIYLRVLSFGVELFTYLTVWCVGLIIPVNYTDNEVESLMETAPGEEPKYKFTDFDKLSLSNVSQGSHRMWAHIFTVYLVTAIVLKLLWRYSKESVLLRLMYIANGQLTGCTHTVLVTDIPGIAQDTAKRESERKQAEKKTAKGEIVDPAAVELAVKEDKPVGNYLRQRVKPKQFDYDLKDTSLDPNVIAKEALEAGVTPKELVESEFHLVYGEDKVAGVTLVNDTAALQPLVDEYNKHKQALEDYLDECQHRVQEGLTVERKKVFILLPKYGPWGKERYGSGLLKKVDGLEFWTQRLLELEKQIAVEQPKAAAVVRPTAFVTFTTRMAQAVSATALHHHDETCWRADNAPEPLELVWPNLGLTSSYRSTATALMWVLFWLMCLFFMIPITAIQGLIDVPKLATVPGLKEVVNNTVIKKLLEGIVPGLALKIFLALVPLILTVMLKVSGSVSASIIDFGVVSRFYIFQVIVVFFGTVIAGSIFSQLNQLKDSPTSIVSVLGTAIPQTTTFFITYLWVNGLGAKPIGFIRIVGLVLYRLFTKLTGSPKAQARLWQEQYTLYGTSVCDHSIAILLGVVYCCINPVVCPSVLVYMLVVSLIERYNHIYVFRKQYESGGKMWNRVFNQVMVALYIFQLTMIGLIALKKFPYSPIVIPVLLPTIIFHFVVLDLFKRPWNVLSVHDAAELELQQALLGSEEDAEQGSGAAEVPAALVAPSTANKAEIEAMYRHEGLKIKAGALEQLLQEADTWDAKLAASAPAAPEAADVGKDKAQPAGTAADSV